MNSKKYNDIKKLLAGKKAFLLKSGSNSANEEAGNNEGRHGDSADIAETSQEQEKAFYLLTKRQDELRQIEVAVSRIEEGEYGLCAECDEEIPKKRLEIQPYSIYCVGCQERMESEKTIN